MSKPSISKLKKKLMTIIKAHVYERDENICQWCGRYCEGSNRQASHVTPVSEGNALAFCPLNIKVLCYHCHLNKWHKNPRVAAAWFKSKFPGRDAYLTKHENDEVHWKLHNWEEMIELAKSGDWEAYHNYILGDKYEETI